MNADTIARAYVDGASLKQLARQFSLPVSRVRDVLVLNGVKIRSRGRAKSAGPKLTKEDQKQILIRYKSGEVASEIAEDYQVSKERVCQICRTAGVIRRPGPR